MTALTIGRLSLSKNICRFELPMDMLQFETLTPAQYLERYCRVTDRRKILYKRCFDKFKLKSEKHDYLNEKLFEDALIDVHMKSINKSQVAMIVELACLKPTDQINLQLFTGLAALSERILFDHFVTEDTVDLPQYQKDKIECADFGSLNSKLDGLNVNKDMLKLLHSL